ncbi:unnamed protein product [Adineta steineri]|uniref:Transmembrane protein n=1 Tax=Adineta steineri TaxID=433720 RepID=A0A813RG07_9BILA|nr:unnamed protein product [Adineta steineri]CAF3651378.1 unnamed protein product [Adineta steineri]
MIEWFNTFLHEHQTILPYLYLLSQWIFLIIYINQNRLYDFLIRQELKFFVIIILQSHSFITASNYIVQWVSIWTFLDYYTSDDWILMLIISIAAVLATITVTGHLCDLVCSPFIISYDSIEYNIRIETPFITEKMNQCLLHVLNYIFYEYVISILSILAWRGFYKLLDIHLYPNNENISACLSLLIGYLLFFILMYTQSFQLNVCLLTTFIEMNYPCFLQNLRHLCAFFSCILLWRGFWILFDIHIATISIVYESPLKFYISFMIISFIILSLMKTASSINGPMSHIDDNDNLFPIYSNCFLSKWFREKKNLGKIVSNPSQITDNELYTISVF